MLCLGKNFAGGAPSHLVLRASLGAPISEFSSSRDKDITRMSWQAVTWVLEQSEATLGSRLVLLSIASHANREGKSAFPTLATIAIESRLCEREVRYCIGALEESGELRVQRGIGRGNPSQYELPYVERWIEAVQKEGGKYSKKGQRMPHFLTKGAKDSVKGAIHDNKRGKANELSLEESATSSEQPLGTVKDITVKDVLSHLSIPKPSKPKSKTFFDGQIEELKRKGLWQTKTA